jgi:dUTPase
MHPVPAGSVLVAQEITEHIKNRRLVPDGNLDHVSGCSYDMTIGTLFWDSEIISGSDKQIVIPPGGVVSILTAEDLDLPNDICATAFAINKMSSRGFLVLNPGHVDPGYKGPLSIKALNVRKVPMPLHSGDPIFTVIFQRLSGPTFAYKSNIQSRQTREHEFNSTVVETSPKTLFDVMPLDRTGPFPGREEVNDMIRCHWLSRWSTAAAIATLLFSAIAAYESLHPNQSVERDTRSNSGHQLQGNTPDGVSGVSRVDETLKPATARTDVPITGNSPSPQDGTKTETNAPSAKAKLPDSLPDPSTRNEKKDEGKK